MHTFWKKKQIVKYMVTMVLLFVPIINIIIIMNLKTIIHIDVFSLAGNHHQVNIYLSICYYYYYYYTGN